MHDVIHQLKNYVEMLKDSGVDFVPRADVRHDLLHLSEDRVVPAARAPADDLVAREVLLRVREGRELGKHRGLAGGFEWGLEG